MSDKLTFYLLKQLNFINDDATKWLGRIVKEYDSPIANSIPSDPTLYLPTPDHVYNTSIADATALLRASSSQRFKTVLANVLGGSYERTGTRETSVVTKKLTRWRIRNDEEVLAKLLADESVKARVSTWLSFMGKPVYFVVGVLVADDIDTSAKTSAGRTIGGNVDIPVIDIATAAAGVPLPLNLGGVNFEKKTSRLSDYEMQGQSQGSQIFAMEYKILRKRLFSLSGKVEDKGYGPTFDTSLTAPSFTGSFGEKKRKRKILTPTPASITPGGLEPMPRPVFQSTKSGSYVPPYSPGMPSPGYSEYSTANKPQSDSLSGYAYAVPPTPVGYGDGKRLFSTDASMGLYTEDESIRRLENPLPQGISTYTETSKPPSQRKTTQAPHDIDQSIDDMQKHILQVSECGSKLDNLMDKTDDLATSAQAFRRGASPVKPKTWYDSVTSAVSSAAEAVQGLPSAASTMVSNILGGEEEHETREPSIADNYIASISSEAESRHHRKTSSDLQDVKDFMALQDIEERQEMEVEEFYLDGSETILERIPRGSGTMIEGWNDEGKSGLTEFVFDDDSDDEIVDEEDLETM